MAKAKKRKPKPKPEPTWYQRMKRTVAFKARLEEILSEWPMDGSDTSDNEMDVDDAYKAWCRDMGELPGG